MRVRPIDEGRIRRSDGWPVCAGFATHPNVFRDTLDSTNVRAYLCPMASQVRRARRVTPVDHNPEALRWLRRQAGIKQAALARRVGVSASLLCEAEAGTRGINADVRARLAQALGCPESVLGPVIAAPRQREAAGS